MLRACGAKADLGNSFAFGFLQIIFIDRFHVEHSRRFRFLGVRQV